MNKNTIFKIFKILFSLVLSVLLTASVLGAVTVGTVRSYLKSDSFVSQVKTADLNEVKFNVKGETVSVAEYITRSAKGYIEASVDRKFSFLFPITDFAVDLALNNDTVDRIIKDEVLELVDYFLNSDRDEAKQRIENNVSLKDNPGLDPAKAKTPEDAVKRYVRSFVIENIESASRVSSDKLIVLFSKKTVKNLITAAVVLSVLLVIINFPTVFSALLYGGAVSFTCGIIIKLAQSKFEKANEGATDLVGYVFLKPLADCFSPSAVKAFGAGVILFLIFIGVYFLFKRISDGDAQQTTEEE